MKYRRERLFYSKGEFIVCSMIPGDDCSNFPKFIIWFNLLILNQIINRYENRTEKWKEKTLTPSIGCYMYDTLLSFLDCSESLSPPKDRP